jgi:hypothetical protein
MISGNSVIAVLMWVSCLLLPSLPSSSPEMRLIMYLLLGNNGFFVLPSSMMI